MTIMNSTINRLWFAKLIISLLLVLLIVAAYYRLANYDFVNIDDDLYVTANSRVQRGLTLDNFTWAFSSIEIANWHPLTWLSHMTDIQVYGLSPAGHHSSSVLLHIANTLLVLLIFSRMTGLFWQSFFLAALFALHPLHVESVAWVAERKDVLSTFFLLLTIWCYSRYAEHPNRARYLAMLLFFILGILSKPMVVTLPFILLLLDFWPLKRFQLKAVLAAPQGLAKVDNRTPAISTSKLSDELSMTTPVGPSQSFVYLIREKIPLFVLSAAACVVTLIAQHSSGTIRSLEVLPFTARVANALISYVTYIAQMIYPLRLAVFYPYAANIQWWKVAGACCILIAISYIAWKTAFKHPYILFGWLWYLGTLFPVIGIVQVGAQAMADRYTYVPLIGLFVFVIWTAFDVAENWCYGTAAISAGTMVILSAVTILSWVQISYWQNSVALFGHAVEVTSDNYLAHNNLGNALMLLGKNDAAIFHYTKALQINPNYADAHYNKARMLTDRDKVDEAIRHYNKAIKLSPQLKEAHYNLGLIMTRKGENTAAIKHFSQALQIDNDYAEAHNNLGVLRMQQNKIEEAIEHFQTAVRLKPDYQAATRNLEKSLIANSPN